MMSFLFSYHGRHRSRPVFFAIVVLVMCIIFLTVTVSTYASSCRLKSSRSCCKFKLTRGRVLKMLEGSFTAGNDVEAQPCGDAVMLETDDVSSITVVQTQNDVRRSAGIRSRFIPIYIHTLSFLC